MLIQNMGEATRFTIIILYIRLSGVVDQAGLTHSLTVQMNHSISGTCSFLDAQFSFISRSVIYLHSGLSQLPACICEIFNPCCKYNLFTCVIPSAMFLIFRILIILPVANMMCHVMVLRKPIPLICMRSQKMVISLYSSRMVLGSIGILKGSTC